MNILEAIHSRTSERFFTDELVSQDIVSSLVDAAMAAPTSCNMQVYNLTYVNDPALMAEFAKSVTGKVNWCRQLFVLTVDTKITFENYANLISAGMVVQNLMLAALEFGLSTCPIAGFKGKRFIRERLGVPAEYEIPLLIFLGYPEGRPSVPRVFRKSKDEVLGVNRFSGERPFPKSSDISAWTQGEIERYRERILSVYFPRLRHGNWKEGLDELWSRTQDLVDAEEGDVLYLFPTESQEFALLDRISNRAHCADVVASYVSFLKERYVNAYVIGDDIDNSFGKIFLRNNLIFQKDLNVVFDFVAKVLSSKGKFHLSIFNRVGMVGLGYRLLRLFGRQRDVYHNSSFYKYGPFGFVAKSEINELCAAHGLQVVSVMSMKTSAMHSKIPTKLKFLANIYSKLVPEIYEFEIIKRR